MNMKMKHIGPRVALAVLLSTPLFLGAQTTTGKIHGRVSDPAGMAETSGTVSLYEGGMASPNATPKYTFDVDANGDYKGDVAPGSYTLAYRQPNTPKDKVVDQIDNIKVVVGQDTEGNDDMSRADYISKLSPEERKALEEAKAKNAAILKENSQIKNLNGDLAKSRSDRAAKNFSDAAALMQKDVTAKPDEPLLWVELGEAQLGMKQYGDAETSLQKGIQLERPAMRWVRHTAPITRFLSRRPPTTQRPR
jgi:tetratricopeptide (TPR) repeat protein